ncbi:MAG: TIGR03000 domain-containing protein, partial [Zavarzinella sp.]|nr:TIGR03000 domain-containing protein [Zavarzinella sp.]
MMRFLTAAALAAAVALPAAADDKKPATIKLLIPDRPTQTEVTIEGQKQEEPAGLKDGVRVFNTPDLEPGKTYAYKIVCVVVPNNYTRITRTREVTFKAGDTVEVDVRKEDPKVKDEIVVRWVPTPDDIVDKMCEMAKVTKDDVVHDYGCGDAIMLIRAVQKFGAKKGFGNDIDPKMVKQAQEKVKAAGLEDKISITEGDILKMTEKDCKEATVVLLYIGDDLGAKL